MLFRFALRERDLPLAGGLARLMRGERTRRRLRRELARTGVEAPSLGALRALAELIHALGLNSNRS